jgi:hypothetical protein
MVYQPKAYKVSDIKSKLLNPALTSHFYVEIGLPGASSDSAESSKFTSFLTQNGISWNSETISLMCSEAVLPGSSLATTELNNDYTGVTERHVYRRVYDDRIDLTFYVDAITYYPIRFFESWVKYTVSETYANSDNGKPGTTKSNYFYRVRFPNEYKGFLKIHKFEKNHNEKNSNQRSQPLSYGFVNVFPISISSMPVSYESSSLLKCTVSMNYSRYYLIPTSANNIEQGSDDNRNNTTSTDRPSSIFDNIQGIDFASAYSIPNLGGPSPFEPQTLANFNEQQFWNSSTLNGGLPFYNFNDTQYNFIESNEQSGGGNLYENPAVNPDVRSSQNGGTFGPLEE